jgi:DNA-binding response OmpR family regulator
MRILLVEDDALLGDGIRAGLEQAGFVVDWVTDGIAGEQALRSEAFDAVVLDLGLPRLSGLDLLRHAREAQNITPVLILTARDAIPDRVAGLNAGADDYLVKPFDLAELQARLRALVRRAGNQAAGVMRPARWNSTPPGAARVGKARPSSSRRASSPYCMRCCSMPAASCRKRNSKKNSTAGTKASKATRWRSSFITSAARPRRN